VPSAALRQAQRDANVNTAVRSSVTLSLSKGDAAHALPTPVNTRDTILMSFPGAEHITASLEIAAETSGDLTAAIYARLFRDFPETERLFVMDRDGGLRGNMLSHAFNTILDFIGERRYAHNFISSEIITHIGYEVPPDAFASFFTVMRDELRAACADQWSPAIEESWARLLIDLERYVARPTHVA